MLYRTDICKKLKKKSVLKIGVKFALNFTFKKLKASNGALCFALYFCLFPARNSLTQVQTTFALYLTDM